MENIHFLEFFDVNNKEHVLAAYYIKIGVEGARWPKEFNFIIQTHRDMWPELAETLMARAWSNRFI